MAARYNCIIWSQNVITNTITRGGISFGMFLMAKHYKQDWVIRHALGGEFLDTSFLFHHVIKTVPSTKQQCSILKAVRGHNQFLPLSCTSQPLKCEKFISNGYKVPSLEFLMVAQTNLVCFYLLLIISSNKENMLYGRYNCLLKIIMHIRESIQ